MLPVSVHTPRVTAKPMKDSEGRCFVHIGVGKRGVHVIRLINGTLYMCKNCTKEPLREMAGKIEKYKIPVQVMGNHTYCYAQEGQTQLGSLHADTCRIIYTPCEEVRDWQTLKQNMTQTYLPSCLNRTNNNSYACNDKILFYKFNKTTQLCPSGYNCTCTYSQGAPGQNGTYLINNGWWLCGHNAYAHLPANWSGLCAPVHLNDHTIIIYAANARTAPQLHSRRDLNIDFKPHDSMWGTDILQEFKHWTEGEKVALSLFAWVGVAKNILRLETVDYRLKVFTNLTKVALTGVKEELTVLRLCRIGCLISIDNT
ncbi:uncharacterized protein LOC130526515 [Takifugu flavidus]|uniref:uncharacterized protein LOC130526515 n=1 Tax=Takifugu flavidus TaxID=433684 RepID=UPI0025440201|nr:uncharacterized protein LOC130526515 [Takifugu flavidus]XP_056890258.1 uncharacterized protein LOC130526515 [Takifugu flavidus]XP_056890259.1 uncharacterized protein LOC130526515 [Takifugu flavidus]